MDAQYYYTELRSICSSFQRYKIDSYLIKAAKTGDVDRFERAWGVFLKGYTKLHVYMQCFADEYSEDGCPTIFKSKEENTPGLVTFTPQHIDPVTLYVVMILTGCNFSNLFTVTGYAKVLAMLSDQDQQLSNFVFTHCGIGESTNYHTLFRIYN